MNNMSEVTRNIPESAVRFTTPKDKIYRPGIHGVGQPIEARTPQDLIQAGVHISYDAAERIWGPEAAQAMRQTDAEIIRSRMNRGISANGVEKAGVVFSR